jgi:hypothetical protein
MRPIQLDAAMLAARSPLLAPPRHDHSGRSALSRRGFINGAGVAAAALAGASVLSPTRMLAAKPVNAAPKPIPNGMTLGGQLFHVYFFGPGKEPATITDFNGFVGVAEVQGTGTATNHDGSTETLLFDTDMRFMKGVYVGQDGAVHKGTFGFV